MGQDARVKQDGMTKGRGGDAEVDPGAVDFCPNTVKIRITESRLYVRLRIEVGMLLRVLDVDIQRETSLNERCSICCII